MESGVICQYDFEALLTKEKWYNFAGRKKQVRIWKNRLIKEKSRLNITE